MVFEHILKRRVFMHWLIGFMAALSLAAFSAPMAQAEYYYSSGV
jgi:hypothetical protein